MSHYNVNASVPKTLIQHLIRWVAETEQLGRGGQRRRCCEILDTEISPELVPPSGTRIWALAAVAVHRGEDRAVRAARLHLYYTLRYGYPPPKVAFLAYTPGTTPSGAPGPASRTSAGDEYDLADDQGEPARSS